MAAIGDESMDADVAEARGGGRARKALFGALAWAVMAGWAAGVRADGDDPGMTVRLASEPVPIFCESDTKGFWPELLRRAYEPRGYSVEIQMVPFARGMKMAEEGQIDGLLTVYSAFIRNTFVPRWHVGMDNISAITLASREVEWNGPETLRGKRVIWIRGYDYDEFIDVPMVKNEVVSKESAIAMLERKRATYYLDNKNVVDVLLREMKLPRETFRVFPIQDMKLYVGFHDGERQRELARIFDEEMDRLNASGELRRRAEAHEGVGDYPPPQRP